MSTSTDKDEDNCNCPPVSSASDAPNNSLNPSIDALLKMQSQYLSVQKNRDNHQHEEQLKQLENTDSQNRRLHQLRLLGIGLLSLLLAFVLVMAFFGNERQSAVALGILNIGGLALGGAGGIFLVWFVGSRLIRR